MQEKVEKPLSKGYYVSKAFKAMHGFFVILWLMKWLDFAADITLNIQYYQGNFEEIPSKEECEEQKLEDISSIACYFHDMKTDKMLGIFCTIIFLLTYLFSFIFVMLDERALHYCATSIGYCCWNCRGSKSNICVKSLHYLMFGFLFLLNDIWTSVYGFWMETFVEYWRASEKKKPKNGKKKKLLNCILTYYICSCFNMIFDILFLL